MGNVSVRSLKRANEASAINVVLHDQLFGDVSQCKAAIRPPIRTHDELARFAGRIDRRRRCQHTFSPFGAVIYTVSIVNTLLLVLQLLAFPSILAFWYLY